MSITKNKNLNPQICKVEFVTTDKVTSVSTGNTLMHRIVNLILNAVWIDIYSTQGTVTFLEEQTEEVAGPFFQQKVEMFFPGEDSDTRAKLLNLENARVLVRITYNSGLVKLLGEPANPCMLKTVFSIEKGGRVVSFTRKSPVPAFLYQA